jgi:glycosyltransferase involved in cell wall biosynthesis
LKVLYFGTYERSYPRNAQVISCLRRAGVEVAERHVGVWEGREHKWAAGPASALRLGAAQARLLRRPSEEFDVVVVGYPGHLDLPAARRAARGKPVAFNPLLSLEDTFVDDRARFRRGSPAARVLAAIDRRALNAADLVVADTEANADDLARRGRIPHRRVAVCFVGAEERVFQPGWQPQEPFSALFVGKLIPLQGVRTIVEAARLAPEIRFRIVGSGQEEDVLGSRPANVDWSPWVEYERLPGQLYAAGCALGIFGRSPKAARVIPNKAFQALACGTPIVTADTAAARELLADGVSALLVPPDDPEALAAAVTKLAGDQALAQRIGARGHAVYREHASEDVLGARWRGLLEAL